MEDPFSYTFPRLSNFCFRNKTIHWEYVDENHEKFIFSKNNIIINNVVGFTNDGTLRKYINGLYLGDFKSFVSSIQGYSNINKINSIETLIGLTEEVKDSLVMDFQYENKTHKKFIPSILIQDNKKIESTCLVAEETILVQAESYPKAFHAAIKELIGKLQQIKNEIEYNGETEDSYGFFAEEYSLPEPISQPTSEVKKNDSKVSNKKPKVYLFEYKYLKDTPEKLLDLYDSLCVAEFLINSNRIKKHFVSIFSGKKLIRRVSWQTHNEDLFWFIQCLREANALTKKGDIWKKTCNCFVDKNNTRYTVGQFSGSHKPSRSAEIEEIIFLQLGLRKPKK